MSGPIFSSYDPATGETVWTGASASKSDIDTAVKTARETYKNRWSKLTFNERSDILIKYANVLRSKEEELSILISKENGKPLWDSKTEVQGMINKVSISLEAHSNRCPTVERDITSGKLVIRHKPHGVVAVFGPFNFPGHLPNGHIVPALLAGNTVVFKPSELTPRVGSFVLECLKEAGLPHGVVNIVQGGPEVGKMLASHPNINGLFFTGSCKVGLSLSEQFGNHPEKILALELGGNNPLVVTSFHDMIAALYVVVQSAYLTSGQRCTCARRLIVTEDVIKTGFIDKLSETISKISIGPYTQKPEPYMGPVISEKQVFNLLKDQDFLISKGGLPIIKMKHLKNGTGFISPGIIDVNDVKEKPDTEYFGPFLQLIRVASIEEAIQEANNTQFGLTAGLVSTKQEEYDLFLNNIKSGVINWNVPLTGHSSIAPFGGLGLSGNHRPSAYYAADYCSYPLTSSENSKIVIPKELPKGLLL